MTLSGENTGTHEGEIITVVIPTYRRPELLQRAIRSVLAQTYPHLRVAVYDNASGDATEAVVAAMALADPRISYHRHAENIGPTANFAYGMQRVETPYFAVLSDDDYYLPTFFATAMASFTAHPDAMCSAGATITVTGDGKVTHQSTGEGYIDPSCGLDAWTRGQYPLITGYVFRREAIEGGGAWDRSVFYWDIAYLWKIVSRFPHVLSREPCAVVILHDQQSTKGVEVAVALHEYHLLRAGVETTPTLSPAQRAAVQAWLTRLFGGQLFLIIGQAALLGGDFARVHAAAAALRAEFRMATKARILALLAALCARSSLLHLIIRAGLHLLYAFFLRYRAWKYRAVRAEIRGFLPDAMPVSRGSACKQRA